MNTSGQPLVLGIDLGTGGVRGVIAAADGRQVAQSAIALGDASRSAAGRHEQSPQAWWRAVRRCIADLAAQLPEGNRSLAALCSASVDGTSGSIVAVDRAGRPLRPAIMYDDSRATAEAAQATDLARRASESGCHFAPFTALANILWIAQHEPQIFEQSSRFIHQADYIVGRLTGDFSVTDYCNALKTGYDVSHERWPTWIARLAGVDDRLPRVVAPGSAIGKVSSAAARETGLPRELTIVAGATDGVAAAVAAGLRVAGDYNTTLGTTLVCKGLSKKIVTHSQGLIYSHKLPGGLWLPGAASNTGAQWVPCWFPDASPQELDRVAERHLPGNVVAYPLVGRGERFPFQSRDAMTFMTPRPAGAAEFYAACLVGTALVERLGYEILDAACGTAGGEVYATGGGSRSNVWMQCRADVTRRVLHRPKAAESAFGSAILAASAAIYGSLERAVQEMAGVQRTFVPRAAAGAHCDELFARFRQELVRRKYVTDPAAS